VNISITVCLFVFVCVCLFVRLRISPARIKLAFHRIKTSSEVWLRVNNLTVPSLPGGNTFDGRVYIHSLRRFCEFDE